MRTLFALIASEKYTFKAPTSEIKAEPEVPHQIEKVEEPKIEETPTVLPVQNFNPGSDCELLRKAMKGFFSNFLISFYNLKYFFLFRYWN